MRPGHAEGGGVDQQIGLDLAPCFPRHDIQVEGGGEFFRPLLTAVGDADARQAKASQAQGRRPRHAARAKEECVSALRQRELAQGFHEAEHVRVFAAYRIAVAVKSVAGSHEPHAFADGVKQGHDVDFVGDGDRAATDVQEPNGVHKRRKASGLDGP